MKKHLIEFQTYNILNHDFKIIFTLKTPFGMQTHIITNVFISLNILDGYNINDLDNAILKYDQKRRIIQRTTAKKQYNGAPKI